jgi:energy-coupling factor transporter ATP-binding protein EcfA2
MEIQPNPYRQVSLYNPETRRPRVLKIKKSDFETEAALEEYVNALKKDNRTKNAEWRKPQRLGKYAELVAKTDQPQPFKPVELPPILTTPILDHLKLEANTGSTVVIYGSSKRGKSTLMMYLYDRLIDSKDYVATLFAGNPHLKMYRDKRLLIGYGFGPQQSKYIMLQQYINSRTNNRYRFLNMFDDIIDQKYNGIVQKMVLTYRNSNISMIMCLQDLKMLSRQSRANVNHTIFFGNNRVEEDQIVIDEYLKSALDRRGISGVKTQITWFQMATKNHGFVYLNNITGEISCHRLAV